MSWWGDFIRERGKDECGMMNIFHHEVHKGARRFRGTLKNADERWLIFGDDENPPFDTPFGQSGQRFVLNWRLVAVSMGGCLGCALTSTIYFCWLMYFTAKSTLASMSCHTA